MLEKICSHCKTTLLVGLHYCPGCLRPIDRGTVEVGDYLVIPAEADDGSTGVDSFFLDLETTWANIFYPVKVLFCRILFLPEPASPPAVPNVYRGDPGRFTKGDKKNATLSLSPGFTRVVCPKCQNAQAESPTLAPSDVVTCHACSHTFPATFAAEFRKGNDLHCARCNVITFCISGHEVDTCPNCRYSSDLVRAKTRIKPRVFATAVGFLFTALFVHAVWTQTTAHFFIGLALGIVSSAVGFVTMVALGF